MVAGRSNAASSLGRCCGEALCRDKIDGVIVLNDHIIDRS